MARGIGRDKVRGVVAGGALGLGGVLTGTGIVVAAVVPSAPKGAPIPQRRASPSSPGRTTRAPLLRVEQGQGDGDERVAQGSQVQVR